MWGGFRVANRAKVIELSEGSNTIEATHDGYKKENIFHTRKWTFEESKIIIEDTLNKPAQASARIHFHPSINKEEIASSLTTNAKVEYVNYKYAPEFNKLIDAIAVEINFEKDLKVEIKL